MTIAFPMALALLAAAPGAPVPPAPAAAAAQAEVDRAAGLIGAGKPAEAIAVLDPLIAEQERQHAGKAGRLYCARSPAEALGYTMNAAAQKKAAVVLPESDCYSLFLKGFALIDLKRPDEARGWLERAVAMAPSNSHFLGELGEWYKARKEWATARGLFQRAVDAAALSPEDRRAFDQTRGMRGLAFILIEEGKLDQAEALYRQCLQIDPSDERSKSQLDYIAERRGTNN